jgi:hypothetical protein
MRKSGSSQRSQWKILCRGHAQILDVSMPPSKSISPPVPTHSPLKRLSRSLDGVSLILGLLRKYLEVACILGPTLEYWHLLLPYQRVRKPRAPQQLADCPLPRIPERRADDHLRYFPALSLIGRNIRLASLEGRSYFSEDPVPVVASSTSCHRPSHHFPAPALTM